MKKIAFFADILTEDFDGASRTMFQLLRAIEQYKMDFFFICDKGPDTISNHLVYRIPSVRIPINEDYSLALPFMIKKKLREALDQFAPDVIHISTPSPLGQFALQYAKKKSIPVISIYHTHFISYIPYYLKRISFLIKPADSWVKNFMRKFYNTCDLLYVPTSTMIKELETIGIDSTRMLLWQRGIDLHVFTSQKRDLTYIQNITGNKKPTILFASRLVWEKNIQSLIDIYLYMESQNIDYNFLIVGDGMAKKQAMLQMPNAFFLGKLDHAELSIIYASSDVFLFTSLSETYGNVVIEAMASGLPCVIANGGGSSSLVQHGFNGFKCTPNSPKEYAYFIQRLAQNEHVYAEIQLGGFHTVGSLDWDVLAQQYMRDIESLSMLPQMQLTWAAT